MTNSDVKHRIASLQGLPVLPHLARELLLALDSDSVHWEELAAIAAFDEEAARVLRSAAIRERNCPPDQSLETHLVALGLPRLAELKPNAAARRSAKHSAATGWIETECSCQPLSRSTFCHGYMN